MDFAFDPSKISKVAADDYSTSDSDSDEETYKRPSVHPADDDDGDGEFNPRKRRRTGRNGKEKAALGIFASDSEDERADRRWGKRRQPLRQQGVSFVSSGAKTGEEEEDEDEEDEDEEDEDEEEKEADDDNNDNDDDYDEDDTGGVGLGFPGSAAASRPHGLGFSPTSFASSRRQTQTPQSTRKPPPPASAYTASSSNALGQGFVPSSAYDPVLNAPLEPAKPVVAPKPSAFSSRPGGGGRGGRGGGLGSTAPNPNSFGARMMAKMGYVPGQGLGKEGHGRNIIIEANLRPQGVGLGAVREKSEKERQEEKRQARLRGEAVEESEDEAAAKRKKAERRKRTGGLGPGTTTTTATTARRPKTKYLTVDEVKKAAPGLHIPEAFTPILDMTGPGQKLLTSASGLLMSGTGTGTGSSTPVEEETAEQAASRKLVRRARADVMAVLEEWQSLQNRKAYAELQIQQEKQALAEVELDLQGHTAMLQAFARVRVDDDDGDEATPSPLPPWQKQWDTTIARLKEAADAIPAGRVSAMRDEVADISVAALHPLLQQALASWDPLKDPGQHMVDGLQSIRGLLGMGDDDNDDDNDDDGGAHRRRRHKQATASPYEVLVYRLWLPHVAVAVRRWDAVRDPDSVLALYEAWRPVLPGFVRAQLLEHDVVRKLDEAVARWEPKRKRRHDGQQQLPHLWLFPWLPYLPARHLDPRSADGLVAAVKRKFRQLVDVWEFWRGVVPGLGVWKSVLQAQAGGGGAGRGGDDQWRPMVLSHVLPAMARYVRAQFRVDAADQAAYLEVLTGEFAWLEGGLVAAALLGEVMVAEVFPLWHEALYGLLTADKASEEEDDDDDDNDNYRLDRLCQWLQWWTEEVFPPALQRLPSVRAELERGLAMVNEALDCCGRDGDGQVVYDAARVRRRLAPPKRGPALESRHHRHGHGHGHGHHHHHREKPAAAPPPPTISDDAHDLSIRHFVEDWCAQHDLQFLPERRRVHAAGPLYRITARGDGKGGVLAYFQGLRLYAETKQGAVEVRADRAEDWAKLLGMAGG